MVDFKEYENIGALRACRDQTMRRVHGLVLFFLPEYAAVGLCLFIRPHPDDGPRWGQIAAHSHSSLFPRPHL